jgi:transcriptional regulator with XRE-family HTH domain
MRAGRFYPEIARFLIGGLAFNIVHVLARRLLKNRSLFLLLLKFFLSSRVFLALGIRMVAIRRQPLGRPRQKASPETKPGTSTGFLGETVRELRKARGLTLEEVASKSKISIGYLSLIERTLSTPSIKTLHDLANTLGVNISWFFPQPQHSDRNERRYVVRAQNRRALNFALGITDELLSPNLSGQLELIFSHLEPGASSGDQPYTHRGEEAGVVMAGEIDLWIGKEKFRLKTGDSFSFLSTTPHRYRNPGKTDAVDIWAVTPPTY